MRNDPGHNPRRSGLLPVFILACAVTLLRVLYLRVWCPYDLVEDEAQYWLWSKHLSLSYYSKGPGIAWAIAIATRIYGDAEWAIRMVPAISGGVATFAVGGLVRDIARRTGWARPTTLALCAALVFALAPVQQASSILATIDGPLLACWAIAAWAAWRALHERSWLAWLALGAAVGTGFLFKYTMVLIVPGVALHAWLARRSLSPGRDSRYAAFGAFMLFVLSCIPIVLWNSHNDWVTLRHLLGHLGLRGGDVAISAHDTGRKPYEWLPVWPLILLLMQIGMWGPLWLLGLLAALRLCQNPSAAKRHEESSAAKRRQKVAQGVSPGSSAVADSSREAAKENHSATDVPSVNPRTSPLFLTHLAAPIFLFYLIVAYINKPEGNWPLAAGVTLVPLGTVELILMWHRRQAGASTTRASLARRWARFSLVALCLLYGLCAIPIIHRADSAARVANSFLRFDPIARLVSTLRGKPTAAIRPGRLIGARAMGEEAGQIMTRLRLDTGRDPFILAQHYGRASQMAYYAPWPTISGVVFRDVYSASTLTWGRPSHFDFMPEHSLAREDLTGRPALILSNDDPGVRAIWENLFEHVVEYRSTDGSRKLPGEHKRDRIAYLGYGFKGLSATGSAQSGAVPVLPETDFTPPPSSPR